MSASPSKAASAPVVPPSSPLAPADSPSSDPDSVQSSHVSHLSTKLQKLCAVPSNRFKAFDDVVYTKLFNTILVFPPIFKFHFTCCGWVQPNAIVNNLGGVGVSQKLSCHMPSVGWA